MFTVNETEKGKEVVVKLNDEDLFHLIEGGELVGSSDDVQLRACMGDYGYKYYLGRMKSLVEAFERGSYKDKVGERRELQRIPSMKEELKELGIII